MYHPIGNKGYHEIKIDCAEQKRSELYNRSLLFFYYVSTLSAKLNTLLLFAKSTLFNPAALRSSPV